MSKVEYSPTTFPYNYLLDWANHYEWKLCGDGEKDRSNANNQLCGATYAELFTLDGSKNHTMIADLLTEFDLEISTNETALWSWVDTLFMYVPQRMQLILFVPSF